MAQNLQPVPGRTVLVTKRGATVNGTQTGSTLTVQAGAYRFTNGDLVTTHDGAWFTTVNAAPASDTSLVLLTSVTVSDGDRIVNLGANDTVGASAPAYDGWTGDEFIYSDPDTVYTANQVTTDSDGEYEFWVDGGNVFDVTIMDADGAISSTSQTLADQPMGASTVNTSYQPDIANVGKFKWDTNADNDQDGSGVATQSVHTEWLDNGTRVMMLGGADTSNFLRIGVRGCTAGTTEKLLVLASQAYTDDLAAGEEVNGIYGIIQLSGASAVGANSVGVIGEIQLNASATKNFQSEATGVQGFGRFSGTHAAAQAGTIQGGSFIALTTSGSTGVVGTLKSLAVQAPTDAGSISPTNVFSLWVDAPAAGVGATINNVARFGSATDEDADFVINSCPVRIDDDDNAGNAAADGRWVDIYRDWAGTDTGALFVGVHMTLKGEGVFTAGDDLMGFRAYVTSGAVAGDAENLDRMIGYEALVDNKTPDETVDEVVGFKAEMIQSGAAGTATNLIGLDVELTDTAGDVSKAYGIKTESLAPSASYASVGHIRMIEVSTATPNADVAALTAAEDGTIVYMAHSTDATKSGFYFRVSGVWRALYENGLAALAADA